MNLPERETPDEAAVAADFSTPADADFTTPGNPIVAEEHLEELDEAQTTRAPETPGDPLNEPDPAEGRSRRPSTPGDPLDERDELDDRRTERRTATPGDPLEER
jgi:hypothetical protein